MAVIPGSLRQSNHADERSVRPGCRMIAFEPFSAARLNLVSSSWLRLRRAFSSSMQSSIWGGAEGLGHAQPSHDFLEAHDMFW